MIFVTGDTHFPLDAGKLFKSRKGFALSKLQRTDYLIVLGDFGLFWSKKSVYNKENLQKVQTLPYTLLFLDGNHENFAWLEDFPVVEKFGGKAQRCGENIFHLLRGEIYEIQGNRFFVCGGAVSIDKAFRQPFVSWWPQEDISRAEEQRAIQNLDNAAGPMDFILTHTCPASVAAQMFKGPVIYDVTAEFLDVVKDRIPSTPWYFGHWHMDKDWGRYRAMYDRVLRLV